jgi:hypothetical protein
MPIVTAEISTDLAERLRAHLEATGQARNSYLNQLIKEALMTPNMPNMSFTQIARRMDQLIRDNQCDSEGFKELSYLLAGSRLDAACWDELRRQDLKAIQKSLLARTALDTFDRGCLHYADQEAGLASPDHDDLDMEGW